MGAPRKVLLVVLEPAEDRPTEWYVATSPDLPGLVTQGKGLDDTVANVKDAIAAFFDGRPPVYSLEVRVVVPV
jgi:predicted RNase H-like HicB family nuclease